MKQQFMIGLMALGMAVLFSGCSHRVGACNVPALGHPSEDAKNAYFVQGLEKWRSPSAGYNAKTRNIHALQNAATLTLERGYKYFAIVHPSGEANNKEGSLINTAEEFINKCTGSSGAVFNMGSHCGMPVGNVKITLGLFLFKEQPADMLTYNAEDVKNYLSKNEFWREDGITEYLELCTKKFLR